MARLMILVAILGCLLSARAQPSSSTSSTVMASSVSSSIPATTMTSHIPATTTPTPTPSSTTPSITASTPAVTPSPAPQIPAFDYMLDYTGENKTGEACLHFRASLFANATYNITKGGSSTVNFPISQMAQVTSDSHCNSTDADLVLAWTNNNTANATHILVFTFKAETKTGNQHWSMGNITFNYTINDVDFKNYTRNVTGTVSTTNVDSSLFDSTDQTIEFQRSFRCNANKSIPFDSKSSMDTINATLHVSMLQVQVFQFKNTTGEFGNARVCAADNNASNKVVPIAVGAALAGLVVVVLIAYLIGRLRNRKQSSYEALS